MKIEEIIIRMLLAMLLSGIIGFNREFYNKSAGLRTHILVCLGATIIALVQASIANNALELAKENPTFSNIFIYEQGRLIAQVVSGIGFLGAGTIIVTKHFVSGLTTAASLWASACLGIAIGMGFYEIAIIGVLLLIIILTILRRLIHFKLNKYIDLSYYHKETTKIINQYFKDNNIKYKYMSYQQKFENNITSYNNSIRIDVINEAQYEDIINYLMNIEDIKKINSQ